MRIISAGCQGMKHHNNRRPTFIDVFAGAGGLSLGLMQAGWRGLFAIEKSEMAFETLQYNLIDPNDSLSFDWPDWLPREPIDIDQFLEKYGAKLHDLRDIELMAGGPPCQGFSVSGRRRPDDERNSLVRRYLNLVEIISPQILLIENVLGFATTFTKTHKGNGGVRVTDEYNAADDLEAQLNGRYAVFTLRPVMARDFGVPQLRPRYVLVAIRKDLLGENGATTWDPFKILHEHRVRFLSEKGLPLDRPVSLEEAISDLERKHGEDQCVETDMQRFQQGRYGPISTAYQRLMRVTRSGNPIPQGELADSHRFPNHKDSTVARFQRIIKEFRPGVQLNEQELRQLNLSKHRIAPLASGQPCHTLTSLPDDMVHYCDPRIPTVREYARIQSFPDWFEFKSKYTTGGDRRKIEVPRYTQVANAVPPLLAEALGHALHVLINGIESARPESNVLTPNLALLSGD